jgi:hypothetical protein
LLAVRRKTAKLRIVLERTPLLVRRKTSIAVEPLSRMMPLLRGLIRTIFPLWRRLKLRTRLLTLKLRRWLDPPGRASFRTLWRARLEMWRT